MEVGNYMNETQTFPTPIAWRTWAIAAVAGAGAFMAMLDSTVANLAIESIRADLGSTISIIQWVATGYLCALAVSLPATGWMGSRYGYGRVWAVSLLLFVATSALCALAPGPLTLIGARLLQGLAGGVMVPAGQAVIGSTVAKQQLGRIMGVLGLVVALGPAIGPVVGGVLLESFSWRWLFWINVPFGIIALIAAHHLVPGGAMNTDRVLNFKALMRIGIGLPLLLYGATEIGGTGFTWIAGGIVLVGAVLIIIFVAGSLKSRNPLIDLRLFRRRSFTSATITAALTGANMYGGLLLVPLYLQLVLGQSVAETGVMLLVMGLGSAFALPIAGALTDRHGAGIVSFTGAVLLLVSTVPFFAPSMLSDPILVIALAIRGMGLALAQMPAMTAAYTAVFAKEMGDASTIVNIAQRVGGAVGAVGVVIILQQVSRSAMADGHIRAVGLLVIISLFTLASAASFSHHRKHN
jgi:EmrB/QacA subfamily drug resistance transporter